MRSLLSEEEFGYFNLMKFFPAEFILMEFCVNFFEGWPSFYLVTSGLYRIQDLWHETQDPKPLSEGIGSLHYKGHRPLRLRGI